MPKTARVKRGEQIVEEGLLFLFIMAEGEQLFKLVYHQQEPFAAACSRQKFTHIEVQALRCVEHILF